MDQSALYRATVEALYAATGRGDWAAAEAVLTEDFVVTEADGLPMAGRYTGKHGLRELYEKVFAVLDVVGLDLQDICIGRHHAVAVVDLIIAGVPPVRVPLAELFVFRGEQICRIRPYYYDPALLEAGVRRPAA